MLSEVYKFRMVENYSGIFLCRIEKEATGKITTDLEDASENTHSTNFRRIGKGS